MIEIAHILSATQCLLAIGLLVQTIEVAITRAFYSSVLSQKGSSQGILTVFLAGRIIGSLLLLLLAFNYLPSRIQQPLYWLLLLSSIFLVIRTRGPLCGGSDAMFFQVQVGLLICSYADWNPVFGIMGIAYIAAQSALSYFLAGIVKLRNSSWRNGEAIRNLFSMNTPYRIFEPVRAIAHAPIACMMMAWATMLFELLFPLLFMVPIEAKSIFLLAGVTFHLMNAAIIGINRFFWAWIATYPALLLF